MTNHVCLQHCMWIIYSDRLKKSHISTAICASLPLYCMNVLFNQSFTIFSIFSCEFRIYHEWLSCETASDQIYYVYHCFNLINWFELIFHVRLHWIRKYFCHFCLTQKKIRTAHIEKKIENIIYYFIVTEVLEWNFQNNLQFVFTTFIQSCL